MDTNENQGPSPSLDPQVLFKVYDQYASNLLRENIQLGALLEQTKQEMKSLAENSERERESLLSQLKEAKGETDGDKS